jgi:hypothetical protein
MGPMLRSGAALLLLCAASAAAEETIWLRGRGSDVWIERNGEMREPRDDRKGVSIISTPARPVAERGDTRAWRGGWDGGGLLPSITELVSDPPYPASYPLDAPTMYDSGYGYSPRYWRGYRHGRGDGWSHHRGHHRFGDDHRHRHRFASDERHRPELHRGEERAFGGHHHGGRGGFGWRGSQRGR